jgi:putative oxidoreductase
MDGKAASIGLFILRLSGLYLAWSHGHGKIASLMHGEGDRFISGVASMGLPYPVVLAWLAASAEFLGGILIFAGLATRVCAFFAACTMLVAAFLRHHAFEQLLSTIGVSPVSPEILEKWHSPELAITYLLAMLALVFCGPGRYSVDAAIARRLGRD